MKFTAQDMNDFKTYDGTLEAYCKQVKKKILDPLDVIFDVVNHEFGTQNVKFPTPTHKRDVVEAVQTAHWFGYYFTTNSMDEIGKKMNDRKFCAVFKSAKRTDGYLDIYEDWRYRINKIELKLFDLGIHRCYYEKRKHYIPFGDAIKPDEVPKPIPREYEDGSKRKRTSEPVQETISLEQRVENLYEELEFCGVNRGVEISREIDLLQAKINARSNRAKEIKKRKRKEYNISKL